MIDFRAAGHALVCLPQIAPEHVALLAEQGFRSIICNRPDEEPGAVAHAAIEAEAKARGLAFAYQPVAFSSMSAADGEAFNRLLASLPGPVAAYCRSGRRSAGLWAMGHAAQTSADAALATTRALGCELDELRPRMV